MPHIAVMLTDGVSDFPQLTQTQTDVSRADGVIFLTVAIGSSEATSELSGIASSDQYAFSVDGFDDLQTVRNELVQAACDVQLTQAANEYDVIKRVKPDFSQSFNDVMEPIVSQGTELVKGKSTDMFSLLLYRWWLTSH